MQHDGVQEGSAGDMYWRWENGSEHDCLINRPITLSRWLHTKRCIHLNGGDQPKIGEDGYKISYKYEMIWGVLIHNVNAISNYGGLYMCRDETYWGCQGWDEVKIGLTFKIVKNLGRARMGR